MERTAARFTLALATLLCTGAALLVTGVTPALAASCPAQSTTTPFARFGDANAYYPVLNGGLENGSTGWSLSGATVASGNETFFLGSTSDRSALSLPTGSSATTAFMCITKDDPSVRFVVRALGSANTSLNVSATIRNVNGTQQSVFLGQLSAASYASWSPSPIYSYSVQLNMPWMLVNGVAQISFTFSSQGSGGSWQVDDVYVDPFKGT